MRAWLACAGGSMLAEAEDALIALVKDSPLGAKLATVASLPELDGDNLVKRFGAEAPAVYVSVASFQVASGGAVLKVGLAGVAKNSRGHDAARKGDGKAIGLYQILESLLALADNAAAGGATWRVVSADFLADETLYKNGLYAGVVRIETTAAITLPAVLDETALATFATLAADYDIPPHVSAAEHAKWLQSPPDYTLSKPELSDQTTLQP